MRLGILISGRGSNMVAIARTCEVASYPAQIAIVISNRPEAAGLARAAEIGLKTAVVDHNDYETREDFETVLVQLLRAERVELVCLAGFMRLLTPQFIAAFPQQILNVHPSLLPAFPGLDAQQQAFEYGVRYSGCTVHLVNAELDAGPIVCQSVVAIEAGDTENVLSARILEQEHRLYREAIRLFAENRVSIVGRRVEIRPTRSVLDGAR